MEISHIINIINVVIYKASLYFLSRLPKEEIKIKLYT